MAYLAWSLPLFIARVCCVDHHVWQAGYNVNRQDVVSADENEDQRGHGSCKWENPPENGFNFRPCSKGWCSDVAGSHKRNGTLRFTRCDRRYVLTEGSDGDTCMNGQWTSMGHQCIPCGRSQNTFNPLEDLLLIRDGHISSKGDFPWMAAIYYPLTGDEWEQICGGTLISPNLVLTAAHCMIYGGHNFKPEEVMVGLGKRYSSYYRDENSSIIAYVKEILRPARYLGADHLYGLDIALLVLNNSVATSDYIMPACIDWGVTMEPKHDDVGYLAGWGKTENNAPSDVLKWATQRYVQYDECKKLLNKTEWKLITHDKFCVAEVNGGRADKGDSGGGLTMLRDGAHYVYGVLSTKLTLEDRNVRLFTDVLNSGHLDWLRRHWQRLLKKPVLTSSVNLNKSKEMCKKFAESMVTKTPGKTGIARTCPADHPSIANGQHVTTREYPHMALFGYDLDDVEPDWQCAGSLISERYVMSAAQCANVAGDRPEWVLLGEYNKRSTANGEQGLSRPTRYNIIEIITHPDFKDLSVLRYNDIALFRLNKDVEFNEYIRPICLPTENQLLRTAITTGYISEGKKKGFLRKVNMTITSRKRCNEAYQAYFNERSDGTKIKSELVMCAGKRDICEGDAGNPLQVRLDDPHCMYSQIGIIAFDLNSCGREKYYPTFFTRVSHFVPWIESIVWP